MAIGYGTVANVTTPAHPLAITSAGAAGSCLIFGGVNDNSTNVTFTNPSGFTQAGDLFINSSDKGSLYAGYKANATGSEGSLSLQNSNSSLMIGMIMPFTGVDTSTPLDVAVVTNQNDTAGSSPQTLDASITPITNGAEIVVVAISDVTSSSDAGAGFSTTAGTTGSWTVHSDLNNGFYNIHLASAPQTTAGAVTVRFTSTGTATRATGMIVMALRPASGGGGSSIAAIANYYRMLRRGTQ